MSENKLTMKQEKFAQEYVSTGNASEAYRRIYDASKMKQESVWRKAAELMANAKVKARVEELKAEMAKEYKVERGYILKSLVDNLEVAKNVAELSEVRQSAQAISKMEGFDKGKDEAPAEVRVIIDYPKGK